MEYKLLIEKVFDYLEKDEVDKAVMGCLRISRNLNDHLYTSIFLRELHPKNEEFARVLFDDISNLKKETFEFLNEKSFKQWTARRTLEIIKEENENGENRNVLSIAVGDIQPRIEYLSGQIEDKTISPGMSGYDTAYFTDIFNEQKIYLRNQILYIKTVKERIKTLCLNYVIKIEKQLLTQEKSESFIQSSYNTVNNYFKSYSEDVYNKLQKATQFIDSKDPEDFSLLLTEVRRAFKSVADYFYPPISEPTVCSDGKTRDLGEEKYLNRLQEYIKSNIPKSTSTDLIISEFEYLSVFARKLNEIASKGVHSDVTQEEAKQGLIGLYLFLYNLISKIENLNK